MITLYQRTDCPFCWKVRLALAEVNVEYQVVATQQGEKHPDLFSLSPKATVPVLIDGDTVIWESTVAVEYINDRFGNNRLYPTNAADRASVRLFNNYSDSIVGPALSPQIFEKRSKPELEWSMEKITDSDKAWRKCLDQLQQWLGDKSYFIGLYSAAECALLPRFGSAEVYGAGVDERHPQLLQWYRQQKKRDSYLAAYPSSFLGRSDL